MIKASICDDFTSLEFHYEGKYSFTRLLNFGFGFIDFIQIKLDQVWKA